MRIYYIIFIIFALFTIVLTEHCSLSKKQTETPLTVQPKETVIVFDLVNLLFKERYKAIADKIGYLRLTSYAATHWKNPGHRCLEMLNTISTLPEQAPSIPLTINNVVMPECIVELHKGTASCAATLEKIDTSINHLDAIKFFASTKEKDLMRSLVKLMLNPTIIADITEPVKPVIAIARNLKKNGYQLYLCTNCPAEFYATLEKKYPEIIELFTGTIVSSTIHTVKPGKKIFKKLFKKYKLDPSKSLLIDSQKNSCATAQEMGMQTITYESPSQLATQLKKLGIN